MTTRIKQRGMFLLEAMIAILIFSFGILGMIGLQTRAISAQSDAQYRIEAANFASKVLSEIWFNVDRTTTASLQTSLAAFQHQPGGANCSFSGAASASPYVSGWVTEMTSGSTALPGATTAMQQIVVNGANFNQVTVTVCWKSPVDATNRKLTTISYVN